jgi:hypothetical protein
MEWSELQHQWRGKAILFKLIGDGNSKVSGSVHRLSLFILHRKPKDPFETHVWDSVWRARHLGLFAIQATQHPTHCEWGLIPHVNNIDPPGVVGQQERRAIMPTTLKRVHDP